MSGVAIEIWHFGKSEFDEVRWLPRIALNRLEARAMAFRLLMEDDFSTRIDVRFGPSDVMTALPSNRRVRRLKATWEQRHPTAALCAAS